MLASPSGGTPPPARPRAHPEQRGPLGATLSPFPSLPPPTKKVFDQVRCLTLICYHLYASKAGGLDWHTVYILQPTCCHCLLWWISKATGADGKNGNKSSDTDCECYTCGPQALQLRTPMVRKRLSIAGRASWIGAVALAPGAPPQRQGFLPGVGTARAPCRRWSADRAAARDSTTTD